MALDRAVDENHVVDCGAGSVSTKAPPPAPLLPPASTPRTSWDQQQEAGHEEDGAGDTFGRRGGAGSGQGGTFGRERGPFLAGRVVSNRRGRAGREAPGT